jgi:hypothetical protein
VANGSRVFSTGQSAGQATEGDPPDIPDRGSRQAWGQTQGRPQMGVAIFSVKGNYRSPVYINLVDMEGGGSNLALYFTHTTVKIIGKGLDTLADGLRRQVIPYIQEQHVTKFEAEHDRAPHWIESIKIEPPSESLGQWAD